MSLSGVVYELALAHLLSGIFGNTFLRYSVSIGFFLLSSGLGSIFYSQLKAKDAVLTLAVVEILLTLLVAIGFPLALILTLSSTGSAYLFIHFCIFAVGFLTGLELPIVLSFEPVDNHRYQSSILHYDFLGSGLAGIIFGIALYPWFGIFETVYFIALINSLVAMMLLINRSKWRALGVGLFVLMVALVAQVNTISSFAIRAYENSSN